MKKYWVLGFLLFLFTLFPSVPLHAALQEGCIPVVLQQGGAATIPLFPPGELQAIAHDTEQPYYHRMLQRLSALLPTVNPTPQEVRDALGLILQDQVPAHSIATRIAQLSTPIPGATHRALGEMTLEETLELLHGGNPLAPTPESLIGKYLAETGATTVVRGFTRVPNQFDSPEVGPQRLVISVSAASFDTYMRYLSRPLFFGVHDHALLSSNGKLVSYAHAGVDFRMPSVGHALPQVVLKPSEAQRLELFLELLIAELQAGKSYSLDNRAMHPWSIPGYCGPGGYVNCTHWIGNIPVGDALVPHYGFPTANNTPGGIVQRLEAYASSESLITRVWKSPGHQQLADVIGVREHNLEGNLASPGYVVHTLLGEAPVERVPFVIYISDDHRAPIDPAFQYVVEAAQ